MSPSVPTIDFQKFRSGTPDERQRIGDQIVASFKNSGFVKLLNHGIPNDVVDGIWKWSRAFFTLTEEQKMKVGYRANPQRGWATAGVESTAALRKKNYEDVPDGSKLLDWKEHWDMGPIDDPEYTNLWPEDTVLPGFREFSERYYELCQTVCLDIMTACELGLQLPETTLTNMCKPASSELRMLRYPPTPTDTLRSGLVKRAWPHTDFGIITLLFQDSVGGLEIEDRSKENTFIPITTNSPYEMAVNISDTFQRWSNDVITAGVHQVNVPASILNARKSIDMVPERYSSVFFFKAHRQQSVGTLPAFLQPGEPAKYDDMTAMDMHIQKTKLLY